MHIQSTALTHTGRVRQLNEDAFLERADQGLWAVADGMGGHACGDLASQALVAALSRMEQGEDLDRSADRVEELIQFANQGLASEAGGYTPGRQPGSTIASLLLQGEQGAVLWAGDSRVYRLREDRFELLTHDHSHVQELIDQGLLQPAQAEQHPMANVITRAVGIAPGLLLDRRTFTVEASDRFLLCSDGLNRVCSDAELAQALALDDQPLAGQQLLDLTLERGAPDNVTLILVRLG